MPGPREPLYLGTAQLLEGYGTAPVLDGLGLILVVTSYLDTLSISATAAHEAVPDLERLVTGIRTSFEELKQAVAAPLPTHARKAHAGGSAGKARRMTATRKRTHVRG